MGETMRNTIRCCISCILPCGALDVIRIVHSNGHVEEISGSITASEIMRAHPKHVLRKPSSPSSDDHDVVSAGSATGGVVPATKTATKIVIVPPDAELQRGKIYFLMPVTDAEAGKKGRKKRRENAGNRRNTHHQHRQHRHGVSAGDNNNGGPRSGENYENNMSILMSDRYLSEILSEKVSTRRRGRVGVWRPHLESISESAGDD